MPTTPNSPELQRVGECLYRSQTSKIYYAILKRSGKQIKRSLKTTDQALAKRRLADLTKKAVFLSSAENRGIPLSALAERWLSVSGSSMKPSSELRQSGIVKKLSVYFKGIQARQMTRAMVEDWATSESKKMAARTFNYERETFVRILDYAVREGIMLDNPVRAIKRHKVRTEKPSIPTKEQFKTLLETIHTLRADALPSADLCELLAYSGCRLNEATSLTWGDINFKQKQFTVTGGEKGTKNHEARIVPLFPALESFLNRLLERYPEPPPPTAPIVSIRSAKTAMISACRVAEFPHFSHHHLRHFFCSNAIEAGIDFKAIAGWLGHKDGGLLVAKTYGHLRDEHSAIMAQRMTFGVNND